MRQTCPDPLPAMLAERDWVMAIQTAQVLERAIRRTVVSPVPVMEPRHARQVSAEMPAAGVLEIEAAALVPVTDLYYQPISAERTR